MSSGLTRTGGHLGRLLAGSLVAVGMTALFALVAPIESAYAQGSIDPASGLLLPF